jgi:hypothetical protein
MPSPLPRHGDWGIFARFPQSCQPSPIWQSGRPVHRHFRGLLGVHSRYGLHTRAVTVYRDTLTVGFSHFVTSMTAPVASGWSDRRVGLAPTGKRRLSTAHAISRLSRCKTIECQGQTRSSDCDRLPTMRICATQNAIHIGGGTTIFGYQIGTVHNVASPRWSCMGSSQPAEPVKRKFI